MTARQRHAFLRASFEVRAVRAAVVPKGTAVLHVGEREHLLHGAVAVRGSAMLKRQLTRNEAERHGFIDSYSVDKTECDGERRATIAAIKAAVDEGRFERAAALLDVLRRTDGAGQVIAFEGRRGGGTI